MSQFVYPIGTLALGEGDVEIFHGHGSQGKESESEFYLLRQPPHTSIPQRVLNTPT